MIFDLSLPVSILVPPGELIRTDASLYIIHHIAGNSKIHILNCTELNKEILDKVTKFLIITLADRSQTMRKYGIIAQIDIGAHAFEHIQTTVFLFICPICHRIFKRAEDKEAIQECNRRRQIAVRLFE